MRRPDEFSFVGLVFQRGLNTRVLVIRCDAIDPPHNTIVLPFLMTSLNGATTSLDVVCD